VEAVKAPVMGYKKLHLPGRIIWEMEGPTAYAIKVPLMRSLAIHRSRNMRRIVHLVQAESIETDPVTDFILRVYGT
jgi:hypothetical protein